MKIKRWERGGASRRRAGVRQLAAGATLQPQRQGSGGRWPRAATLSTAVVVARTSPFAAQDISHNPTGDVWSCGFIRKSLIPKLRAPRPVGPVGQHTARGARGRPTRAAGQGGAGSTAGASAADDRRLTCPAAEQSRTTTVSYANLYYTCTPWLQTLLTRKV